MLTRRLLITTGLAGILAGCASKFRSYSGPEVTRIQVFKGHRTMQLLHKNQLLKSYTFELGFQPRGHKTVRGDGKTPEGAYLIDRKNPNSSFHLSLGISYPDIEDFMAAQARGENPGGDIFIHGTPSRFTGQPDWTWGCIAVTNDEVEEIYAMVNVGTPIYIYP